MFAMRLKNALNSRTAKLSYIMKPKTKMQASRPRENFADNKEMSPLQI